MPKKILIINVNWLGDVIFSTPFIRSMRENFPDAHIAVLVVSSCAEVLRGNPRLNEIIVYDEYGKHSSLWQKIKFIASLRQKKFDEVYILHRSLKRAMIGFLANIPKRVGYDSKRRGVLLTQSIPHPLEAMHKIDYFLGIIKACGLKAGSRECEFFVSSAEKASAEELLVAAGIKPGEKFAVLNPGGNWLPKRWPVENFARLADLLWAKGVKSVVVGAKKDIELAVKILTLVEHKPAVVAGKTNLHELGAIMLSAICAVTADSGPMHIGLATGANILAVFGPTSPELTGPVGRGQVVVLQKKIGCDIPCFKADCADFRCMSAVTPEEVCREALKFLVK